MVRVNTAVSAPRRLAAVRSTGLLDTPAEPAFDRLADLAATFLDAPLAFVTLVDDTRSFWKACVGTGIDPADATSRQNAVEESFCQYVVGSREPLIIGDTRDNPVTRDNPAIEAMGVLAWAGFPVFSPDGHVLGSFCVVDTVTRRWTARDVHVLETLAQAAAGEFGARIALEQASAAERSASALARTLQDSLLPPVPPSVPGLDVAALYRPAGTGTQLVGDFFDLFQTGAEGSWAATIGDVSGKGIEAAKVSALARHTIRGAAMAGGAPSDVLAALNAAVLAQASPSDSAEPRCLTATYAQLTVGPSMVDVRLASAGHCPTVVRRSDRRVESVCVSGLPLGWFPDVEFVDGQVVLAPGDCLILHSDGVTEARRNGQMFGDDGLARALQSVPAGADAFALAGAVEASVLDFAGEEPADDMAVLVIRVP
jgi:sigma-B regulation protein RsbU (phosphoserine phosphatase)